MEKIIDFVKKNKKRVNHFLNKNNSIFWNEFSKIKKYKQKVIIFLSIENPIDFCTLLKIDFTSLEKVINHPAYHQYYILKKKGGKREICEPEENLKSIQRKLNYYLQLYYLSVKPKEVNGFVIKPYFTKAKCNIAENAKYHIQKKHVLNIDLKDFFPSIDSKRVKQILSSELFDFSDQISTALALLTTYQGKLPTGAPTSPVISNFVCLQLDHQLKEYCHKNDFSFSRYADDLTFSSNEKFTEINILELRDIIKNNNFEINEKKFRLKTSNRKQTVTGLTVNDKVNVDRVLLKKIRAMVHDLATNGLHSATCKHYKTFNPEEKQKTKFMNRVSGYVDFVGQIRGKDDKTYLKYISSLKEVTAF